MVNIYEEYIPDIKINNKRKKYYILFDNNKVEVNKIIYMQFFGVHKNMRIDGKKRYLINYEDAFYIENNEISLEKYYNFRSFKSENMKNKNIYNRYIEHSKQFCETVQERIVKKTEQVEDIVYRYIIKEEIQTALMLLNEIQKKRFIIYYIDEMTYEQIAQIEECTKRAIKFSVDTARKNLQKELKNSVCNLRMYVVGVTKDIFYDKVISSHEINQMMTAIKCRKVDAVLVYRYKRISIYDDLVEEIFMFCQMYDVYVWTLKELKHFSSLSEL